MNFIYKNPSTPEQLMRNRYEAFVNNDGKYLKDTAIESTSTDMSIYKNIEWLKLDVLNSHDTIVEFKAYFRENGLIQVLHEKSNFVMQDGEWKYVDGEFFNSQIQRNELCPCGSLKKYKKCCMKN